MYRCIINLQICFICELYLVKNESHLRLYCFKYSSRKYEFYRKISNIVPNFKKFAWIQAIGALVTSRNHHVNIQFTKFISPCFNQRNIRPLSSKTDLNCLLYFNLVICSRLSESIGIVLVFESFFKKVCRDNTVCILLLLLL